MWKQEDKYKDCCHNDGCEEFDTCIECWDEWSERNPPMTNADRIRSMTDEELVEHFAIKDICHLIRRYTDGWCSAHGTCDQCARDWLKQPYGGADHE